ncbi:MAG: ABC transporter ATP-binding protein [Actinomycetota bacterium]|jgi:sn-glycerol 3-phosphate transport system ATP-binding protein/multiple sugar transport system ATP-binding protein|uniref:ABC transporter ATP-binding protein n=1 Tax=Euzebya pacifica TaxID=1608957 RepID=UPI0030FB7AFE
MAGISIESLHKQFPDGTVAVHEIDLEINDGELFVLLGPSGCGKTTTLRCIAGLETQTSGDIRIGDKLVNDLRPGERDIAMVFQFYALYPHLTGRENIGYPLRAAGVPKAEAEARIDAVARTMRLDGLLQRKPNKLSGGEQQRIALARAMVREPQAFLLDEPLTNLDAELRLDMRTELKHLQDRLGATMVMVTHDQVEAMSLGDRIALINDGRLEQVGTPLEVYDRPASLFAATFIGTPAMNILPVEVDGGALRGPSGLRLPIPAGLPRVDGLVAGVRAEWLSIAPPTGAGGGAARVVAREALGDETIYAVDMGGTRVHVRTPPTVRFDAEDTVDVTFVGTDPRVYHEVSGKVAA